MLQVCLLKNMGKFFGGSVLHCSKEQGFFPGSHPTGDQRSVLGSGRMGSLPLLSYSYLLSL